MDFYLKFGSDVNTDDTSHHPWEYRKRLLLTYWEVLGKAGQAFQAGQQMAWESKKRRPLRLLLWLGSGVRGRVLVLRQVVWFDSPTSTKGEAQVFLISLPICEAGETREAWGLQACQQTPKKESDSITISQFKSQVSLSESSLHLEEHNPKTDLVLTSLSVGPRCWNR